MGRTTLNEDYFFWLYSLISEGLKPYAKLCRGLHQKTFKWFVHNDDNRCSDGKRLRDIFVENERLDERHLEVAYFLKSDCTVFEVLVALAQRMNDIMYDLNNTRDDKTPIFFGAMIENLGLVRFTDSYSRDTRFDPVTEAKIDEIIEVLLERTYDFDGRGGLFPLKKRNRKDQAEVEIWYQMMSWLDENYG